MEYVEEVYIKLAEKNDKAGSKAMVKILQRAMTPEEAAFILALPAPSSELAAKFNMSQEAVEEKIRGLAQRGLVTASRKGHRYPRDPGTLHDNILASAPQYMPPDMPKLWMDLYEGENWWREIATLLAGHGSCILRSIPVLKSTPPDVRLLPHESITDIIQAHKDLISVRNCCCRVGKGCKHPVNVCTQFGSRAEFDLYRGSGRRISVDEAMAISEKAGQGGLVPTVTNISRMEALEYICYCCGDACMVLNPTIRLGNVHQVLASSRFVVTVDNALCDGCGECVPWCYFDAIEMKKVSGSETKKAVINREACVGCGICVLKCKPLAMTMKVVRPPEYIPENIAGPSSIVH